MASGVKYEQRKTEKVTEKPDVIAMWVSMVYNRVCL